MNFRDYGLKTKVKIKKDKSVFEEITGAVTNS